MSGIKRCLKSVLGAAPALLPLFLAAGAAWAAQPWEEYDYSRFERGTYLYDNTGGIGQKTFGEYAQILTNMRDKYGVTYVFVLAGDYAGDLFEFADYLWEYGGFDEDYIAVIVTPSNGRLFRVDTYGRGVRIMTDSYVDGMWDALEPSLKAKDYEKALADFAYLAEEMTKSYRDDTSGVKTRDGDAIQREPAEPGASAGLTVLVTALFFIIGGGVTTAVVMAKEMKKHRPVKMAADADWYIAGGEAQMDAAEDTFLRTHTARVKVASSSPHSGGSSSGSSSRGGSTSSGSSGRSRGGR
ncbi:MAG: TPM domain-containing protein [Oscillospiraceae bacterium]|jgi:uncharacterized membrane protein YgcG|nr:TPM domain-containing protein [Oscillospiraceae bacterium]